MGDSAKKQFDAPKSFIQLIKFALVGVLNTLVDFLVYTLLVLVFGISENNVFMIGLFTLIAYACGVLNSFILNTRWTFRQEYKRTAKERVMFVVVNIVSWGFSYLLVWLFSNHVFSGSSINDWVCSLIGFTTPEKVSKVVSILSKLLATPFVIIVNFLGNKLLVFNKK